MTMRSGDAGRPRRKREAAPSSLSLEGMHSSVAVPHHSARWWQQYRAFVGPALLVSVGYMDPGNWGTDLQGGAEYGYRLLWVVALASLMAIVLQVLSARLGLATGKDLAQACRDWYPRWTRLPQWMLCELAIAACDLAEVLGSAVAINLLFDIPILWAVVITAFDVFLLLALQRYGVRTIEAVIAVLVGTIAVCFFIELFVLPGTRPDFGAIGTALVTPTLSEAGMATVAIGIIGATVMPHNLYLHSALVQSRRVAADEASKRTAMRFNTIDTVLSLGVAFLINAAILVLAAVVFYGKDSIAVDGTVHALSEDTDWIRFAYLTFAPVIGTALASILFAVALLASGQSSTITGTLAGQVVMEGFMRWKIDPWKRRVITRAMAIVPAIVIIALRGDGSVNDLLVLSQVVLAMQLPFAMFPLLHFTSRRRFMGAWASGPFMLAAGWASAFVIAGFDIYGLPDALGEAARIVLGWS